MRAPRRFCTLFDVHYAARAVALHHSLLATHREVELWMFCMDNDALRLIQDLRLDGVRVVGLAELERHDPELATVKPTRSRVEYLWTCTPAVCLYCLEGPPDLDEITYLDADLWFFSDSSPLFEEMGDASVLITPHRFAPEWEHWGGGGTEAGGIYNVQFMTFRRTADGLEAVRWWRERCIEWCYLRHEPGRYGDQKYLDDWPERFQGVHVLEHPGGGLAPWNTARHVLTEYDGSVAVDGRPLVFHHYHGLEIHLDARSVLLCAGVSIAERLGLRLNAYHLVRRPIALGWRTMPTFRVTGRGSQAIEYRRIWAPYAVALARVYAELRTLRPGFRAGARRLPLRELAFWTVRQLSPRGVRAMLHRVRARVGCEP